MCLEPSTALKIVRASRYEHQTIIQATYPSSPFLPNNHDTIDHIQLELNSHSFLPLPHLTYFSCLNYHWVSLLGVFGVCSGYMYICMVIWYMVYDMVGKRDGFFLGWCGLSEYGKRGWGLMKKKKEGEMIKYTKRAFIFLSSVLLRPLSL